MKARITAGLCASMLFSASAMADDALREQAQRLFEPIPTAEVVVEQKGVTPEQIELGKWLFFEPRISASHIITCNTCHSVGTGGADNIPASIGHGWQAGPRNSPTVLNAVFNAAQFWDGRASDLAEQAKGPIQVANPGEGGYIGNGVVITHNPCTVGKVFVQYAKQPARLIHIAVARALVFKVLAAKLGEKPHLTKHGPHAAHLEHEPLYGLVAARRVLHCIPSRPNAPTSLVHNTLYTY